MSAKEKKCNADREKTVEICIAGRPVSLSFAKEPNTTAAQRVRNCLIDSYIRQTAAGRETSQ